MVISSLSRFALLLLLFTPLSQAAVILQYHHVSDETPASTSTSPERFAMHLDYLEDAGFEIVPLQDLVGTLKTGQPLPDKTAAITFDDGYISIYKTAWPMLRKKGWPFTVFINTEPHDQRKPLFMSWDQLRELHGAGATIANHTVSHPYLLRKPPGQDNTAWQRWISSEITDAAKRIEQEIGENVMLFAYPFGEFDNSVLDVVGRLGYTGFGQHSGPLAPFNDPRALPRFPFGGPYGDRQDFATKVNSLPMPLASGADTIRWETAKHQPLDDIVIAEPAARPRLLLRFEDDFEFGRLNCFATRQGRIPVTMEKPWVYIQAERPLSSGRSRYNCTAASGQAGHFFWFSQPWIIR